MLWRFIVRFFGGLYEVGPYMLMAHDAGVLLAKDQVVVREWPKRERPRRLSTDRMAAGE